jgi:hypothetical protein
MKYLSLFISLLFVQALYGQSKLPIIKATSKTVGIKDDGILDKEGWSLSPTARPDVYRAERTHQTKWVVFYTDIDSIKVKVKPGSKFDFIILLNGKDSCFTQIVSAFPPLSQMENNAKNTPDTIPFILTAFNAIHVKAVFNDRDTMNLHLDFSSFDFRLTRDAILKKTHLLDRQPDALAGKVKPNYNNLEKVSKVQMGNMVWKNPEFGSTGFTAREMDGRFGGNVFENKIVEIDYDKNILIVHAKMPKNIKGYAKSKLTFIRSFPCIKGVISIKNKEYAGDFILDNGSDQALIIDSVWAAKQHFPTDLKTIKITKFKDPRGVVYENKTVLCPLFKMNNHTLSDIPTSLLGSKNPTGFEINLLGNDVLKRFNTILDFQNDYIYFKPNKLTGLAFKES